MDFQEIIMDQTEQITNLLNQLINEPVGPITDEVDTVQLFIDLHLRPTAKCREMLGAVHRAYLTFCADKGFKAKPMYYFPGILRDKGLVVTNGARNRFYVRGHQLIY
jgi:hypothetical protein